MTSFMNGVIVRIVSQNMEQKQLQNRLKLKHNIVNTSVGKECRIYRQLVDPEMG